MNVSTGSGGTRIWDPREAGSVGERLSVRWKHNTYGAGLLGRGENLEDVKSSAAGTRDSFWGGGGGVQHLSHRANRTGRRCICAGKRANEQKETRANEKKEERADEQGQTQSEKRKQRKQSRAAMRLPSRVSWRGSCSASWRNACWPHARCAIHCLWVQFTIGCKPKLGALHHWVQFAGGGGPQGLSQAGMVAVAVAFVPSPCNPKTKGGRSRGRQRRPGPLP